jgi:4-amino-4-deoxy-L-arabinose transferase-like glycosyltransferase
MTPSASARAALLAVVVAVMALRLAVVDVPLERDEGEFAYMGQLILRGETPYLAAANMKLPGAYYAYAAILGVFGESVVAIRTGLLLVNLLAILLVYRLGTALLDDVAGAAAATTYAVLSLDPSVLGFTAKGEHFVVPPLVAGLLLLVRAPVPRHAGRLIAAGVCLGLAVVMKQHAAIFLPFAVIWAAGTAMRAGRAVAAREAAVLAGASLLPFAAVCAGMLAAGAFEPFWFWTVRYAREYATLVPLAVGLGALANQAASIAVASPPLWALAALGVTAPLWDAPTRGHAGFLGGFAVTSLLATVPGLRFSEHYFILVLPAASLLAGAAVSALARRAAGWRPAAAAAVAGGLPLVAATASLLPEPVRLFARPPAVVARSIFGTNPFPEAVEVARYLAAHSTPAERIAVIGSEPEIYFLARRQAAVPYMYVYPLMEPQPFAQRMQEEMIARLAETRPRFLVLVNVSTSWTLRPDSSRALLDWVERAVNSDYRLVGLADIMPDGETIYRWDAAAAGASPASADHVAVFERRR